MLFGTLHAAPLGPLVLRPLSCVQPVPFSSVRVLQMRRAVSCALAYVCITAGLGESSILGTILNVCIHYAHVYICTDLTLHIKTYIHPYVHVYMYICTSSVQPGARRSRRLGPGSCLHSRKSPSSGAEVHRAVMAHLAVGAVADITEPG